VILEESPKSKVYASNLHNIYTTYTQKEEKEHSVSPLDGDKVRFRPCRSLARRHVRLRGELAKSCTTRRVFPHHDVVA
jgi:hypothetical protein